MNLLCNESNTELTLSTVSRLVGANLLQTAAQSFLLTSFSNLYFRSFISKRQKVSSSNIDPTKLIRSGWNEKLIKMRFLSLLVLTIISEASEVKFSVTVIME